MDALLSATATADVGSLEPREDGRIEMDHQRTSSSSSSSSDPSRPRLYNFQVASHTLDASVKIWSNRVDSVHTDTYKVLGELNRTDGADSSSRASSRGDRLDDDDDVDGRFGDSNNDPSHDDDEEETGRKKKNNNKVSLFS